MAVVAQSGACGPANGSATGAEGRAGTLRIERGRRTQADRARVEHLRSEVPEVRSTRLRARLGPESGRELAAARSESFGVPLRPLRHCA